MLGGENVELEAKLGSFHIKGDPYRFPDLEAGFYTLAYNPQPLYKFVSEVQQQQFDFLRKMVLNGRIENYRLYRHDPEIKYIQTHTIDSMYTSPDDPTATIRVTRNLDGEVLACISKQEALGMFFCLFFSPFFEFLFDSFVPTFAIPPFPFTHPSTPSPPSYHRRRPQTWLSYQRFKQLHEWP
jgi:hypothetical protein